MGGKTSFSRADIRLAGAKHAAGSRPQQEGAPRCWAARPAESVERYLILKWGSVYKGGTERKGAGGKVQAERGGERRQIPVRKDDP